jgi:hypothetical protein
MTPQSYEEKSYTVGRMKVIFCLAMGRKNNIILKVESVTAY